MFAVKGFCLMPIGVSPRTTRRLLCFLSPTSIHASTEAGACEETVPFSII